MSLYPCVALLVGVVIQRSWESSQASWWQRSWDRYVVIGTGMIAAAGIVVPIMRVWGVVGGQGFQQVVSARFAIAFLFIAAAAVAAVWWSRRVHDVAHARVGIFTIAAFLGFTYTAVVVGMQVRLSNDPSTAVAAVRALIPPSEQLASFGQVHHLFAYYYEQPIELHPLSAGRAAKEIAGTYFCYLEDPGAPTPVIPFAWQPVAEISCERAAARRSRIPKSSSASGWPSRPPATCCRAPRMHDRFRIGKPPPRRIAATYRIASVELALSTSAVLELTAEISAELRSSLVAGKCTIRRTIGVHACFRRPNSTSKAARIFATITST